MACNVVRGRPAANKKPCGASPYNAKPCAPSSNSYPIGAPPAKNNGPCGPHHGHKMSYGSHEVAYVAPPANNHGSYGAQNAHNKTGSANSHDHMSHGAQGQHQSSHGTSHAKNGPCGAGQNMPSGSLGGRHHVSSGAQRHHPDSHHRDGAPRSQPCMEKPACLSSLSVGISTMLHLQFYFAVSDHGSLICAVLKLLYVTHWSLICAVLKLLYVTHWFCGYIFCGNSTVKRAFSGAPLGAESSREVLVCHPFFLIMIRVHFRSGTGNVQRLQKSSYRFYRTRLRYRLVTPWAFGSLIVIGSNLEVLTLLYTM